MNTSELIAAIDQEIARLQQVQALLSSGDGHMRAATQVTFGAKPRKQRKMSAKAKAAIRAAQKERWAKWRAARAKK